MDKDGSVDVCVKMDTTLYQVKMKRDDSENNKIRKEKIIPVATRLCMNLAQIYD